MFAVNVRQDRVFRAAQSLPFIGQKILNLWLKHTDSGITGLSVDVSNLSTNYCEARLHFSKKIQQGDYTCGLAQLCEWVAAACYSYTHHQRLSQKLARWNMEIHKPIRSDVVAIARILYGPSASSGNDSQSSTGNPPNNSPLQKTSIQVEVLDIHGELVASAAYLLASNPITR